MNYRIYIRENLVSGSPVVVLEVEDKVIQQHYHMTQFMARWRAYRLNEKIKAGKIPLSGNLYEGTIK